MPRNVGVSVENAFNRGLVTEVTGVNSPENSVVESLNFVYDRRGRAVKRKGFNLEENAFWEDLAEDDVVYTEYVWKTLFDNTDRDLVVLQIGSTLHFYESTGDTVLSGSLKGFYVDLLTYKSPEFTDEVVKSTAATYSTGRGYLFVAHPNCTTIYVKYDHSTDSIEVNPIDIRIRDFKGVEDGLSLTERPSTISGAHRYNLYNQGWYANVLSGTTAGVTGSGNPVTIWDAARSDFPSNSDVWWYFTGVEQTALAREYFSTQKITGVDALYGNTPAPKGHYILDPFNTDRAGETGISGLVEESSDGLRPSVVGFYAGRVFYAGVGKSGYASRIYFSQIIENDNQLGRCYQANDPTSKEIFDLLDSDGGVIEVQDITTIHSLQVIGQVLYVFASNGVWSISGTDATPFKATNYSVSKVTSESTISQSSIVEVSGFPIWWNYEGIFSLRTSDAGLTTDVSSLSTGTIQEFYDSIPQTCKEYAKGVYNRESDLIYWIYSDDEFDPTMYSNILVLDAVSLAFYPLSIPTDSYRIRGLVPVRSTRTLYSQDDVITLSLDSVVTSTGDSVYVLLNEGAVRTNLTFKFITTNDNELTFSEISGADYLDWGSYDYDNYFITGYRIRGEILRKSQTNYLTIITDTMTNSSGFIQPVWDYANTHDSGRFGNPQSFYKPKDYRDYQISRLKIRGSGRSLQFKIYGTSGSPLSVVGWMGYETTNASP